MSGGVIAASRRRTPFIGQGFIVTPNSLVSGDVDHISWRQALTRQAPVSYWSDADGFFAGFNAPNTGPAFNEILMGFGSVGASHQLQIVYKIPPGGTSGAINVFILNDTQLSVIAGPFALTATSTLQTFTTTLGLTDATQYFLLIRFENAGSVGGFSFGIRLNAPGVRFRDGIRITPLGASGNVYASAFFGMRADGSQLYENAYPNTWDQQVASTQSTNDASSDSSFRFRTDASRWGVQVHTHSELAAYTGVSFEKDNALVGTVLAAGANIGTRSLDGGLLGGGVHHFVVRTSVTTQPAVTTPPAFDGIFMKMVFVSQDATVLYSEPPTASKRILVMSDSVGTGALAAIGVSMFGPLSTQGRIQVFNRSRGHDALVTYASTPTIAANTVAAQATDLGFVPDFLWMGDGVNDYLANTETPTVYGTYVANILDAWHAQWPSATIPVLGPSLTNQESTTNAGGFLPIAYYNAAIAQCAGRPYCVVVDRAALFAGVPFNADNIHPSDFSLMWPRLAVILGV